MMVLYKGVWIFSHQFIELRQFHNNISRDKPIVHNSSRRLSFMVVLSCVKLTKKINKDADNYTRSSMRYLESCGEMREDIAAKFLVIEKKFQGSYC